MAESTPPDGGNGLTPAQAATLEAIADRLIPSDETGPGAREAMAVRYVLRALATDYREHRSTYAAGLLAVDRRAEARCGAGFAALAPERQDAVLSEFAESGREDERAFFELVRRHVVEGMFGDPGWGGNAGRVGWDLLGYAGPRPAWTLAEQSLDAEPAGARRVATREGEPEGSA